MRLEKCEEKGASLPSFVGRIDVPYLVGCVCVTFLDGTANWCPCVGFECLLLFLLVE